MTRPVGNKNALDREVGADGLRDWSYGLLNCCAVPRLCTTTNSIGPSLLFFLFGPRFFQVAGPRFVLASSTARTSSDYAICIAVTVLSQVEVTTSISTAVLTVAWPCLASIGSFRYVGMVWTVQVPVLRGAQMGSRADIRNRYDIRGDSVEDCLSSLCCRSCALAQERREIELEEKSFP